MPLKTCFLTLFVKNVLQILEIHLNKAIILLAVIIIWNSRKIRNPCVHVNPTGYFQTSVYTVYLNYLRVILLNIIKPLRVSFFLMVV